MLHAFRNCLANVRKIFLLSILAAFMATSAPAATYHVAQTANASDSNPGTECSPWRTLDKAAGEAQADGGAIVARQIAAVAGLPLLDGPVAAVGPEVRSGGFEIATARAQPARK